MVATCESNEYGRFLTESGLVKLSLEAGWRVNRKCCFSRKDKTVSRKKHRLFVFLLGASYMQKGSETEFSSLAEEI